MTVRRTLLVPLLGALGLGLVSCWPDRLADKACNEEHPCVEGYVCLSNICYEEERILFDGGLPPDVPAADDDEGADAGQ